MITPGMNLLKQLWLNFLRVLHVTRDGKPDLPKHPRRICARCNKPILKHNRWSAKAWLDDPRPRHWDCDSPTGEPHGKNTETVEVIRAIVEENPAASAPETFEALCEADSSQTPAAKGAEDSNSPSGCSDAGTAPGGLGEGRAAVCCMPEAVTSGWRPVSPDAPDAHPE
jgi:hypothetical protein